MDNFREEIIVRRTGRTLYSIAYILTLVFMVAAGLMTFMFLLPILNAQIDWFGVVGLIVSALFTFLLWRNKDTLRTEYEYTLTNGEMDFAKVLGNTRRKHLLTLQLKTVEQGGPVESDAYKRLASGPNVKKTDLTLNATTDQYFLYYSRDGVRNLIILEPSTEMVGLMRIYNRNLLALG